MLIQKAFSYIYIILLCKILSCDSKMTPAELQRLQNLRPGKWNFPTYACDTEENLLLYTKGRTPMNIPVIFGPVWSNSVSKPDNDALDKCYAASKYETYICREPFKTPRKYTKINLEQHQDYKDIYLPPFSAEVGLYKYIATIQRVPECQKLNNLPDKTKKQCFTWIAPMRPQLIMSGGNKRQIYRNEPINIDIIIHNPNDLTIVKDPQYYFSYKLGLNGKEVKQWNSTLSNFTLPNTYKVNDKISVWVEVFMLDQNNNELAINEAKQDLSVAGDKGILLKIVCKKNCPPVTLITNYESDTFFEVLCVSNCDGITKDMYTWSLEEMVRGKFQPLKNFDYEKDTVYGQHSDRFIIKKNTLKPTYRVSAHIKATVKVRRNKEHGYASTEIDFLEPHIKYCYIQPVRGFSLKTPFYLKCATENALTTSVIFDLYLDDPTKGGKLLHSGRYNSIGNEKILLPPSEGHKFFVKARFDRGNVFDTTEIKRLTVNPAIDNKLSGKELATQLNHFYGAIDNELKSTNPQVRDNALGKLVTILENAKKVARPDDPLVKNAINDLKFKVCKSIQQAPITRIEDVMKTSDAVVLAMDIDESKNGSDPLLYQVTQVVCKKLATSQLDIMQNKTNPMSFDFSASAIGEKLTKCTEMNSAPNQVAIEPIQLNLTTVLPTVTGGIVENYPDYNDYDEEYYQNLAKYKIATDSAVNTTILSAKVIALTMTTGEETVTKKFGQAEILIAKDTGSELCKRNILSQNVQVIPSPDWNHSTHNFDILISTWSRDIMWWNPNHTKLSSNIIKVEFWHSTCKDRVNGFDQPADVIFKLKENGTEKRFIDDTIQIPWKEISIFRVEVDIGHMLRIVFYNLTDQDFLDVTMTINSIPREEDFQHNITVSKNATIHYRNAFDSANSVYIGILPNAKMSPSRSGLKYSMCYFVVRCVRWEAEHSQWISQCSIGFRSNMTHLSCECKNFSIISTNIEPTKVVKVKLVVEKDFELELQPVYIVIGTVFVIFAMYCLISSFFFKTHTEEVYFLADNQEEHQYGYVVVVRTGGGAHASTSSNVVIKLTGNVAQSEPHLLNYPDPQMRMLQRNGQDIFIITTENSLGDEIELLELWYDSIGFNATWYCQDVYVYDLQTHKHWYFKVRKQLCVLSGVSYIAVKPATNPTSCFKCCNMRVKVCDSTHPWRLNREEYFTRLQRLTFLLSNIMVTLLLVGLTYPWPEMKMTDCLDQYRKLKFDEYTVLRGAICSGISFGVHFTIKWIFRCFKGGSFFSVIYWFLLFGFIFISMNVLIIFGFWLPFFSSLEWLFASMSGLAISALVYENLLIILRSMFQRRWKPDIKYRYDRIMTAIGNQKYWLFRTFGPKLLRPYFGHLYNPMNKEQIRKKKEIISRRRVVLDQVIDFAMFSIYIIVLYMVILMNKSSMSQISNRNMINLMEGKLTRSLGFSKISTFTQVYDFLKTTLIPVLQSQVWYGKFVVKDPGLMIDMNNKYLGVVRMRQHRMPKDICKVAEVMKFLNMSCWPEFNLEHEETRSYGYRWENAGEHLLFDRLSAIWTYMDHEKAGTLPVLGTFATYGGGGYISFLGRTYHNSIANFHQIKQKKWIDEQTRCVFIEFLTYNDNHNEFNAITLLLEQSATGHLITKVTVQTARMLFLQGTFETIKFTVFCVFVAWVFMLIVKQSSLLVKKARSFYKDPWFFIDLFIITMSGLCIGTFYIRTKLIQKYLNRLEKAKHNEFINYFHLFYMEDFLTMFGAVLVAVATIRIWRFLRFGRVFRMMERTLVLACSGLLSIIVVYFVFLLAYGFTGVLLYGTDFEDFFSIVEAIRTMMLLILFASYINYDQYITVNNVSYFFFGSYSILVIVIMTCLGIILMEAYVRAQIQFSEEEEAYTVKHYFQEKMRYWPLKLHYKLISLKGGNENRGSPIYLKSGDVRFDNTLSIELNKLNTITTYAKCILKNCIKYKGKKIDTSKEMMGLVKMFLHKLETKMRQKVENEAKEEENEEHIFFKGHIVDQKTKLVDEDRIFLVKDVVEKLLKDSTDTEQDEINPKIIKCFKTIRKSGRTLEKCEKKMIEVLLKFNKCKINLESKLPKTK